MPFHPSVVPLHPAGSADSWAADPVPVASVQGTLALDLTPRQAPPPVPDGTVDEPLRRKLEQWSHRYAQAAVEIVGGDRPVSQLLRWSSGRVYADLQRRALLVARAGAHQPGEARVQPVRPRVASVRTCFVSSTAVEAGIRIRYGARSRALAARFELRQDRWVCTALDFS